MLFTKISMYHFVIILFFSQLMVSCSDRNSSDDNKEVSQIASDPTNVCSVSPDNHSPPFATELVITPINN